ncbi:hypothetical protein OAF63_06805 [Saprospiraceae bacterium]|jgi:hypothetical protein|nr:hypothetical protein [Bacteroidota bacterium]MDB4728484.1 hypothetical protein [Saprospiraceae bacterium]MDF1868515.1 hypothetical protein [Saprospiraceae bacterium]
MGVTIHFRGSLDEINRIYELMDEVTDICESMDWEYNRVDDDWEEDPKLTEDKTMMKDGETGLKGIFFKPNPDCEVIALTFTGEGYLNSMINLAAGKTKEADELPWVFAKTQFAGAENHVSIVKLLKYLKHKYSSNLEVRDEGGYWETGDINQVAIRMEVINNAMKTIEESLSELQNLDPQNLTKDTIMKKIEAVIQKLGKEQGIEMRVLRIDQVFEEKGINLDLDINDLDVEDSRLN